jgi:hypothetical protein
LYIPHSTLQTIQSSPLIQRIRDTVFLKLSLHSLQATAARQKTNFIPPPEVNGNICMHVGRKGGKQRKSFKLIQPTLKNINFSFDCDCFCVCPIKDFCLDWKMSQAEPCILLEMFTHVQICGPNFKA